MENFNTIAALGACLRIENLLQKSWICAIFRFFSSNRVTILLKKAKNRPKPSFPSLRSLFSDKLLVISIVVLKLIAVHYYLKTKMKANPDNENSKRAQGPNAAKRPLENSAKNPKSTQIDSDDQKI